MPTKTHASVQLFGLREAAEKNLDGVLSAIAGTGLKNIELYAFADRVPELSQALSHHGLSAPSGHAMFLSESLDLGGQSTPAPDPEQLLDAAAELGISFLVDPFVPLDRWQAADEIAKTAEKLNEFSARAASRNITVGYHNHTQEFASDFDGRTGFELFASQLDPAVKLEIDLYWAVIAGQHGVELLKKLGSQVRAIHVKDGAIIPDPFTADPPVFTPPQGQVPVGQGEIPIEAALAASPSAELAVIEFDHYEGDMYSAIAESFEYLKKQGVSA